MGNDDYASATNAKDNNESDYFSEDVLSKSDEQEVTDEFFYAHPSMVASDTLRVDQSKNSPKEPYKKL